MKPKKVFFTEAAYLLGILVLALGTALMARADFGMSVVVAPAYVVYLKLSQLFPGFTFGMAEYCLQAVLLVVLSAYLRKFHPMYLFSFVSTLFYGLALDLSMLLAGLLPPLPLFGRFVLYAVGMLLCVLGVSLLFHTYIPPEAYELFVKEISAHTGAHINLVKTVYDCCSCLLGILLSFAFFGLGRFEGVKGGTVLGALVNGFLIGRCGTLLETRFAFRDALPLREKFDR